MKSALFNLISFKAGWAAVIFAAAASMPEFGLLAVATVVVMHLVLTPDVRSEFALLLVAAGIGLVWESILVNAGLLQYDTGQLVPGIAPYWIVAMWVLFATTLNVGMRWMRRSVLIAAAAGAAGGPLAFLAGERVGAVTFTDTTVALAVIGLGWAVLLPMLVGVARRYDGHEPVFAPVNAR